MSLSRSRAASRGESAAALMIRWNARLSRAAASRSPSSTASPICRCTSATPGDCLRGDPLGGAGPDQAEDRRLHRVAVLDVLDPDRGHDGGADRSVHHKQTLGAERVDSVTYRHAAHPQTLRQLSLHNAFPWAELPGQNHVPDRGRHLVAQAGAA